ncbi:hypothetical protein K469DRAFT_747283 [Zopfia rhizophila CBS 207.26]|uniref:Uncharacterized protein n=1 Tax=Zopfia rhizophila CBS 207.26 TaxID=1314779 RepID=A0A6A6EDB4_9PEZI|nr:hypothetical protein K469DRAFT_747283 [Zopfia rhizophila CBS 207.26]
MPTKDENAKGSISGQTADPQHLTTSLSVSNGSANTTDTASATDDGSPAGGPLRSDPGSTVIAGTVSNYWSRFHGFKPDPTASWSAKSKKQSRRRAEAYEAEFGVHFGSNPSKLETWQDLCKEVGIEPVPKSITQCKKALKSVLVNLVNLIDHRRNPDTIPLIEFASFNQFREFTTGGHIFPKKWAKRDGFFKALLRQVY